MLCLCILNYKPKYVKMEKQRTRLEKFILLIAYMGLIGGTLFAFLYSKGVLESGQDMCVPRAIANFIFIEGASILGWAVLKQIVKISDRLRHIENKMDGLE